MILRPSLVTIQGANSPWLYLCVQHPQMVHDFALTPSYAIFLDGNLLFDPSAIVKTKTVPLVPTPSAPGRIGLVKKSEPENGVALWFEVPSFYAMHTAAAWEEGSDTVCLAMCECAP